MNLDSFITFLGWAALTYSWISNSRGVFQELADTEQPEDKS